jgi:opacity protein-like surface antigen
MKSKLILITLFVICMFSYTSAQQASINFSLALPQGEFGEQVDNLGYGLSGEFMFLSPTPKSPFGIGLNLGYYIYGKESRREPWSLTIPDVFVDVDRTNNLLNFHLVFEVGMPSGRIRPYIQGLFGGNYLYTQTSVSGEYGQENIATTTNFDDWAWSYGVGGGIAILLSGDPVTEQGAVYLDLKGRYLFGSEADYLKEGSIQIVGSRVVYNPSQSKTDLLTLHAGVRIAINFHE